MQTTEEDEKENFASENIDNSLREDLVAGKSFRKKGNRKFIIIVKFS